MKPKKEILTRGSGNIFADLDLPNPEELQLKARLTHLITRIIKQRGWTQQQAAKALGIKQPDVSELSRGERLEHYSVERLMHFLSRLEQKVTITVSSKELPSEEIVIAANVLVSKGISPVPQKAV
jgi:predicted XRE-type DNA-binding protein